MPFIIMCNPCYTSSGHVNPEVVAYEWGDGGPYYIGEFLCAGHAKYAKEPIYPK